MANTSTATAKPIGTASDVERFVSVDGNGDSNLPRSGAERPLNPVGPPSSSPEPGAALAVVAGAEPLSGYLNRAALQVAAQWAAPLGKATLAANEEPPTKLSASWSPRLAWESPPRQQLVLLNWLAVLFAAEERGFVDRALAEVQIERLHQLHGAWLPDRAGRFERGAAPSAARGILVDYVDDEPRSWEEVVGLTERAMAVRGREDQGVGCDAFGWRDTALLRPAPPTPSTFFERLVAEIVEAGGPIDGPHPADRALPDPIKLVDWVCRLRWTRPSDESPTGAAVDAEAWALAAGRLRFWASRNETYADSRYVLECDFRPNVPWARMRWPGRVMPARKTRTLFI